MKRNPWPYVAAALLALGVAVVPLTADHGAAAYKAPAVSTPLRSDVTTLVQTRLKSFGYTIVVDGLYGPQTTRVVKAWQKANGIPQTGFAGKLTLASLGKISFATAAPSPAVRSSPPVSPPPVGGESNCDEMSRYRQAAGLPEQFDAIGYRESRCQNTAGNSCCVGYLALHYIIFSDHRMIPLVEACGATHANIQGDDDGSKRRQMCVAKALYDVMGMTPWNL